MIPSKMFCLGLLALAFTGCLGSKKPVHVAPKPAATVSAAPPSDSGAIKILDSKGAVTATLRIGALEVKLGGGATERVYHSNIDKNGRRTFSYSKVGESARYEVKSDADGFKLWGPSKLLWKVKYKDDKIKVSDNEANQRPISLKRKLDRIEVLDDTTPLGEVRFEAGTSKVGVYNPKGELVGSAQPAGLSAAYGLLLSTRIQEDERALLLLEILTHGF